jgi:hypothetical protein
MNIRKRVTILMSSHVQLSQPRQDLHTRLSSCRTVAYSTDMCSPEYLYMDIRVQGAVILQRQDFLSFNHVHILP